MGSRFRPGQRVRPQKICRRHSDGTLWMPSYPEGWTAGDAIASLAAEESPSFYFRRVTLRRRRLLPDTWVLTGATWEPRLGEFQVLDADDAKGLAP